MVEVIEITIGRRGILFKFNKDGKDTIVFYYHNSFIAWSNQRDKDTIENYFTLSIQTTSEEKDNPIYFFNSKYDFPFILSLEPEDKVINIIEQKNAAILLSDTVKP